MSFLLITHNTKNGSRSQEPFLTEEDNGPNQYSDCKAKYFNTPVVVTGLPSNDYSIHKNK
jgi:hypothetical protein